MTTPATQPANSATEPAADLAAAAEALAMVGTLDIRAAASAGAKGKARFSLTAYNGGRLNLSSYYLPVVVDLAGMDIPAKFPLLMQHENDVSAVAGQVEKTINDGHSLTMEGALYAADPRVAQIVAKAKDGHVWQASIGAQMVTREYVEAGQTVQVNGQSFDGPLYVARQSKLVETSIVAIGADTETVVSIAAKSASPHQPPNPATAEPPTPGTPTEVTAMATATQTQNQTQTPDTAIPAPPAQPAAPIQAAAPTAPAQIVVDMRAAAAQESQRIGAIRAACSGHAEIEAQAIAEGWTADRAELHVLRASRPAAPSVAPEARGENQAVLEAAMRLHSSEPRATVEAAYQPQVLERASKMRSLSIRGLIAAACRMEGIPVPELSASPNDWMRAAFSTVAVPGILGNVANKVMFDAFMAVPSAAKMVARKLTARDFKTHTGYRIETSGIMQKVTSGGEVKYGELAESSYPYAVETYGEIIGITRQMLVNDDLNAFLEVPMRIGMKSGMTLEHTFWAMVVANAGSFFGSGNLNVDTGALGVTNAGYDKATQLLEEQVDAKSNPIGNVGRYVAVPPALAGAARRMHKAENLLATALGATNAKVLEASANVYQGMYEPLSVPHLKAAATTWYLVSDPARVPAFGIAYLNGVEAPVVEEVDLPAEYLGRAWRGVFDFGTCFINPQGAVKMS